MKYCRYHDLAFCDQHAGQCLGEQCSLVENTRAPYCSVCAGIVRLNPAKRRHATSPSARRRRRHQSGPLPRKFHQ